MDTEVSMEKIVTLAVHTHQHPDAIINSQNEYVFHLTEVPALEPEWKNILYKKERC